nr:response regulator [Saprospiraceae bacterium]
ISVESEISKGATFHVTLPIQQEVGQTVTAPEFTRPPQQHEAAINTFIPAAQLKKEDIPRILIVEDNADVLQYLTSCIGSSYQLDYAYNGRAGIERALEIIPDLIISDVMMPEKDGFEVCDTLKNDQRSSHIPIILLTAKADLQSRIAGLSRGADAYLKKPFHQHELLVVIQNLLALRKQLHVRYAQLSEALPEPQNSNFEVEDVFVQKLRGILEEHLADPTFGIPQLCRVIGLSRSQLHKKIKAITGYSTSIYWRNIRLQHAKIALETTDRNVSEVAYDVGFNDPKYFSRLYTEKYGIPPSETNK